MEILNHEVVELGPLVSSPESQKRGIDRAKAHARSRGGDFLSTVYKGAKHLHLWECEYGHKWSALYLNVINKKSWCPKCYGRLDESEFLARSHAHAKSKGGKFLSIHFGKSIDRYQWECSKEHRWLSSYDSVMNQSTWCPYCSKVKLEKKKSLIKLKKIARDKNGECLSTSFDKANSNYKFRCASNHEWEATYSNMAKGAKATWCPICSNGLSERIMRDLFEQIFNCEFPKKKPVWLVNSRGNQMEYDGFAEHLGLAFEYQGEHHYHEIKRHKHDNKRLLQRQEDDECKQVKSVENGVELMQIPYYLSTHDVAYGQKLIEVVQFIKNEVEKVPELINQMGENYPWHKIKAKDFVDIDSKLAIAKGTASQRNGQCLSGAYLGSHKKHLWECEDGHQWEATYKDVVSAKQWCGICAGNIVDSAEQMRIANKIAHAYGGRLLTKKYTTSKDKYKWKCCREHTWSATFSSIVSQGTWCKKCSIIHRKIFKFTAKNIDTVVLDDFMAVEDKLAVAKKVARQQKGKCLSEMYLGSGKKHLWECKEKHQWSATYHGVVSDGKWCGICGRNKVDPVEKMRVANKIAQAYGGQLLTEKYTNSRDAYKWRCRDGHIWEVRMDSVVSNGNWCKKCRKTHPPKIKLTAKNIDSVIASK